MSLEKIALDFEKSDSVYVIVHGEKYYVVSRYKYSLKIRRVEAASLFGSRSKEEIDKISIYVNEQELLIRILPFDATFLVNLEWINKYSYKIPI